MLQSYKRKSHWTLTQALHMTDTWFKRKRFQTILRIIPYFRTCLAKIIAHHAPLWMSLYNVSFKSDSICRKIAIKSMPHKPESFYRTRVWKKRAYKEHNGISYQINEILMIWKLNQLHFFYYFNFLKHLLFKSRKTNVTKAHMLLTSFHNHLETYNTSEIQDFPLLTYRILQQWLILFVSTPFSYLKRKKCEN